MNERPLPDSLRRILAAMDRLGAHDPLMAVRVGPAAQAAGQNPETMQHLLNRLVTRELVARDGMVLRYWLTTEGLAEARKASCPAEHWEPGDPLHVSYGCVLKSGHPGQHKDDKGREWGLLPENQP